MKTYFFRIIIIVTLFIGSIVCVQAQENYYSYQSSDTVHYTLNKRYIAVQFDTFWVSDSLSQIWNRPEWDSIPIEYDRVSGIKNYISFFINYPTDSSLDTNTFYQRIKDSISTRLNVSSINPLLISESGDTIIPTQTFFVKLRRNAGTGDYDSSDILAYHELLESTNTEIIQAEYLPGIDLLSVADSPTLSSLEAANMFYESGYFTVAEPNLISEIRLCTNDTYYTSQWGINNTGQSGGTPLADADVDLAWQISTGCSEIKTAILDEGVDYQHPDLSANMLQGATFPATGAENGDTYRGADDTFPITHIHGTPVAGILGAVANNFAGIAGVAYSSKMVSFSISAGVQSKFDNYVYTITPKWFSNGIKASIDQKNVDIICLPFMMINGSESSIINEAIDYAVNTGRNGLGSIVIAASGGTNGNGGFNQVGYPASRNSTICVGSTNRHDRKSGFSNFGDGLDVCAPGDEMQTTDVVGTKGYSADSYTIQSGTSLSTSFVAGIMALILSVQPTLTATEARYILESTCDKVWPNIYNYASNVPGHPNGTWCPEMGYGRVNARAAVEKAATMYIDDIQFLTHRNYFAKKQIIAGNGVRPTGSHGPVDIGDFPITDVTFRAGKEIALMPGFSAFGTDPLYPNSWPGATFSAFIDDDCTIYDGVNGIKPPGGSSAKAGLAPAEFIPPTTQESALSLSPNPVSGVLRIRFAVAATSPVYIDIMNLYGQRIAIVVDGEQSQGNHNFKFDVSDLTNGMYFVQLRTPSGTVTKPIIVTH